MRPLVCQAQHIEPPPPFSNGASRVDDVVLNWMAATRLHIQNATFVQKYEPGIVESYVGRGVARSLSIRMFLAEEERMGSVSPLCTNSSSSVTIVAITCSLLVNRKIGVRVPSGLVLLRFVGATSPSKSPHRHPLYEG